MITTGLMKRSEYVAVILKVIRPKLNVHPPSPEQEK